MPIVASPSGLPTQHLVSARDGAEGLFVAQQWLQPGDRVLLHTHPVEEAITFLSGSGEATLGEETVPIGAGVSLYIPAGVVHGFRCTEGTLHVMVVFPVPEFAETTIVEPECSEQDEAGLQPRALDGHPNRYERVVATRRHHRQYLPHDIRERARDSLLATW